MSYPLYEDKLDQETATSLVWQSYPILVRGQESQELRGVKVQHGFERESEDVVHLFSDCLLQ